MDELIVMLRQLDMEKLGVRERALVEIIRENVDFGQLDDALIKEYKDTLVRIGIFV